jgi:hypothetical protein
MDHQAVVSWVEEVCAELHRSQAKTLARLTAACLRVGRATFAALGRKLPQTTSAKHRIKRAYRFCANERVHVSDAMAGVLRRLTKRRKKPLLLALDWTELGPFHTLMAAAVMRGRAVPLLWASYRTEELHKSQNALEEGLLVLLAGLLPARLEVILLADRGFGRTELARTCQQLGWHYLIRIKPDVYVEGKDYRGLLCDYPVFKGIRRLLRGVLYRKEDPVVHDVVIRWRPGLPAKRDEPWFLMTDLGATAVRLTELYGGRMSVEELFRDDKSMRNGFGLRHTRLSGPGRVDRLLLVVALAYLLLVGLGLLASVLHRPGAWCSNNREGECSAFTIGREMLDQMDEPPERLFELVRAATVAAAKSWG